MQRDFAARLESSDFSCDGMEVAAIRGREAISQLGYLDVDVVVPDAAELDASAAIGAGASLVVEQDGTDARSFHGMIAEIDDRLDTETSRRSWRLRLVPRAYRLTLVETQEVFLDLSVPDIIRHKLELAGLAEDTELRLAGDYPPREFVVQYEETDLAFISRLAEHLGISFFFEHESGRDRIVFTDHAAGFRPLEQREQVPFPPRGDKRDIHALDVELRAIPTAYLLQDYNYRTPRVDLTSRARTEHGIGGGVVEYGAHYKTPQQGKALANVRAEEREARRKVYAGAGSVAHFVAGARCTIQDHPRLGDVEVLLVEVEHRAKLVVGLDGGGQGESTYESSFRATDATATYRPPRQTPKPRIHGVITALIEPENEGVGTVAQIDEDGRYTVRFFFDTAIHESRRASSRPVRMIQPHAGPHYGHHFPLRPGVELAIVFVGGDPDRPLIAGAIPNPVTPSPVTRKNALVNQIVTASGISIRMKDS